MRTVNVKFSDSEKFEGLMTTSRGSVKIGAAEDAVGPYDMLFGALASCLYATFAGVAKKKRLTYSDCNLEVVGEKREEIPTHLTWGTVKMTFTGVPEKDQKGIIKSCELAGKYCSIYYTLEQVAKLNIEVIFE
jgi:putative redox protein